MADTIPKRRPGSFMVPAWLSAILWWAWIFGLVGGFLWMAWQGIGV